MPYSKCISMPGLQVPVILTLLLSACDKGGTTPADTTGMSAAELAQAKGCVACHAFSDAAGIGPGWVLPWGQPRKFTDGSTLTVNEAYLRLSMQDPGLNVVEGYPNLMVQPELTDAEREKLVTFIRELSVAGMESATR
jgi:cytochrome c1